MRRRRPGGDPMRNDRQISAYLRSVGSSLDAPRSQRRRVLEEIENHLDDGAAAHMRQGATRDQAVALVIDEPGSPDAVASGFNQQDHPFRDAAWVLRWLPLP